MYLLASVLVLFLGHAVLSAEQTEHRDFQYNSVVDPMTGRYNFAYDTGNDNEIAHTMHMQYRDANGIVRGRYGYTDPRGKLRVVEYEAGPKGFVARGDVGPDQSLHDQNPETQPPQSASYTQDAELQLDPRPVQMAGWDPLQNPMGQPIASTNIDASSEGESATGTVAGSNDFDGYATTNITGGDTIEAYVPVLDPYDDRYPRLAISTIENSNGRELESLSTRPSDDENKSGVNEEVYPVAVPETINSIDVNPDEIREAASGQSSTVARSADGDSSRSSRTLPYSYRNYLRQTHDHAGEIAYPYRSVYIPSHGHYHYVRQPHDHEADRRYHSTHSRYTHDHDAEHRYHNHDAGRRYYAVNRQTHDHDAEKRYSSNRQTHDHDAEKRYASNRQTHDHDAEKRYYVVNNRYTHDHDAERDYYRTIHQQNNPHRRRIFYRDNHSMEPHEHYSDIYHNHNDRSHQHSDVHLYGTTTSTSQSLQVPPTSKPGQLKYISSDKYHDKYYYWGD